eukprot:5164590-Amphidinium_carterae.1
MSEVVFGDSVLSTIATEHAANPLGHTSKAVTTNSPLALIGCLSKPKLRLCKAMPTKPCRCNVCWTVGMEPYAADDQVCEMLIMHRQLELLVPKRQLGLHASALSPSLRRGTYSSNNSYRGVTVNHRGLYKW